MPGSPVLALALDPISRRSGGSRRPVELLSLVRSSRRSVVGHAARAFLFNLFAHQSVLLLYFFSTKNVRIKFLNNVNLASKCK